MTAKYTANNQVSFLSQGAPISASAPVGFSYDAAGNVTGTYATLNPATVDTTLNQYKYDAEGRLCAVRNGGSGQVTQYLYDASGVRVGKATISTLPAAGATCAAPGAAAGFLLTKQYLLDLSGDQVTELDGSGNWVHSNVWAGAHLSSTYDLKGQHFHLADPLGTRRVQTNVIGQIEETCQSLPFGDVLNCATTALSTADDATPLYFTGKERDSESGNDYFGARYYASSMGRFMSPDWAPRPRAVPYADFTDPQTLNLYSYVRNNPLNRSDSDGHCGDLCNWAISKVSSYLATHPAVGAAAGAAVDKAMNSLGVKVFAGVGVKANLGPVQINANATVNVQSSVDGSKDGMGVQATVGARAGDVGVQALNVSAPVANSDGLVNPLSNVKVADPSLTTSSSLTPKVDGMDIAAKETGSISDQTATAGVTVNGGIALVGAQVSADISGWKEVAAAVVQGAVSDAKQFVTDVKTSLTCTATAGCAH